MNIALNIGRSRSSILSITLALYLFSIGVYISLAQDLDAVPAWIFLTSFVPIILGFTLALSSLLLFLLSQRLDAIGSCEIWTFSVAELLMYLALAQTLSGGLSNFVSAIGAALSQVPRIFQLDPAVAGEIRGLATGLYFSLQAACGLIWGLLVYAAPAVFVYRIPLRRDRKWVLITGYAIALLGVFWISAYPYQIKARTAGKSTTLTYYFARQFWQPSLWRAGVSEVADLQRKRSQD
jgi:hypothetical protein